MARVPYDDFADIYDAWCGSAPITAKNLGFYHRKLLECPGPVAELGVGNGRICIEVAKRGKPIIGVDSSGAILDLCRRRAREAGNLEGRLSLLQADFRDFVLPEPAELIVLPFHSLGHLLTEEGRLQAMRQVRSQLREGGRFIFDHFLFDPAYVQQGVPRLRAEYRDPATGRDRFLWEASTHDLERQLIRIVVFTDEIDSEGVAVSRRYRRMHLSWVTPDEVRRLLEAADFEVEALYGDFDENPLTGQSTHQIWVVKK